MIAVTLELPVDVVSKKFREGITVTEKNENTLQLVFGLGFHSSTIENDDHNAFLLALLLEIHQPGAHAPNSWVIDCGGYDFIERKLSPTGSTQHVGDWEERVGGCLSGCR